MPQNVLDYVVQYRRFELYEDVGCLPSVSVTWVAIVLAYSPPIAIGLVSGTYAVLSIRAFYRSRAQSKELFSLHSGLTNSRYIRLMALAATDLISSVPVSLFLIIDNSVLGLAPWTSWDYDHAELSQVSPVSAPVLQSMDAFASNVELTRWLCVACALVFFAFFGFSSEARKHYNSAISSVRKHVGASPASFGSSSSLVSSSEYVI